MSTKRRSLLAVIVLGCLSIVMLVVASACNNKHVTRNAQTSSIKISVNSWIGWAPLYLADEKGFFNKYNVDVQLVPIEDIGTRKATMISGQVQGYGVTLSDFALDSSQGVPGRIALLIDESYGADGIAANQSIKTVADLKGQQIAFQAGSASHFFLLYVLDQNGLSGKDVKQIDMDADKAGAAFTSGKIPAAVTWEPWLSKANQVGGGHILTTTKDVPGVIVDTLIFRNDVLSKDRAAVEGVLRGYFDALQYWKDNPQDAVSIMAKQYKLSSDDFKSQVAGVHFLNLDNNRQYLGSAATPGKIYYNFDKAGQFWKANGIITGEPTNAADRIDPSLIGDLK
ncbi:MAG: ABC transporter substrate-binding protein [Blastocatellia bacterium]